jgi:hypothetical protein
MLVATPIWCRLLMQEVCLALVFALLKAGNNMAANMAMMAITTNNSISVKPRALRRLHL